MAHLTIGFMVEIGRVDIRWYKFIYVYLKCLNMDEHPPKWAENPSFHHGTYDLEHIDNHYSRDLVGDKPTV